MRIIIISGRSGSGKSSTLRLLEDLDYYCVDNVPADLIPSLIEHLQSDVKKAAISIDARNIPEDVDKLNQIITALRQNGDSPEIIYLDADRRTLLNRFTETRRKHPLTKEGLSLKEAINKEKRLLLPIVHLADLVIDTSGYNLYQLREAVTQRLGEQAEHFSLLIESFGYKFGVPIDSDYVFDARFLPNPYWHIELREYSGLEKPIVDFLEKFDDVEQYFQAIVDFSDHWIPKFKACNRSYMTLAIGCTGGHHRSVYLAERIFSHYQKHRKNVQLRHRELP